MADDVVIVSTSEGSAKSPLTSPHYNTGSDDVVIVSTSESSAKNPLTSPHYELDREKLNQYQVKKENPQSYMNSLYNSHRFIASGYWLTYLSAEHDVSSDDYGWKVHVNADNPNDWQKISSALIPYLIDNDIAFKTISKDQLNGTNGIYDQYVDKSNNQYAKAFTIYPENDVAFRRIAREVNYILENNKLNDVRSYIRGDHQIGNHGRLFYRNVWLGKDRPGYRSHSNSSFHIYKPDDMDDPFTNVLGYPNDNTYASELAKKYVGIGRELANEISVVETYDSEHLRQEKKQQYINAVAEKLRSRISQTNNSNFYQKQATEYERTPVKNSILNAVIDKNKSQYK